MTSLRIEDLRDSFYLLEALWTAAGGSRVQLETTTATDHFYTDGLACGSLFKLTFSQIHAGSRQGPCCIVFVYPSLRTACLPLCSSGTPKETEAIVRTWIDIATQLFGTAESRARQTERMRCWKEELIAAAWHPRRVARWIEQEFYGD